MRRMLFTLAAVSFSISPYSTLMPAMAVQRLRPGRGAGGPLHRRASGWARSSPRVEPRAAPERARAGAMDSASSAMIAGPGRHRLRPLAQRVASRSLLMMMAGFGMFLTGATCNTIIQTDRRRGEAQPRDELLHDVLHRRRRPSATSSRAGSPSTSACAHLHRRGRDRVARRRGLLLQLPTFRRALRPAYITRGIIPEGEMRPPTSSS